MAPGTTPVRAEEEETLDDAVNGVKTSADEPRTPSDFKIVFMIKRRAEVGKRRESRKSCLPRPKGDETERTTKATTRLMDAFHLV
jgi:hypothetical protein